MARLTLRSRVPTGVGLFAVIGLLPSFGLLCCIGSSVVCGLLFSIGLLIILVFGFWLLVLILALALLLAWPFGSEGTVNGVWSAGRNQKSKSDSQKKRANGAAMEQTKQIHKRCPTTRRISTPVGPTADPGAAADRLCPASREPHRERSGSCLPQL